MTEITYQYQEDLTGENPDNLIPNEYHLITSENNNTYDIIIPIFAPFFTTNLKVKNRVGGGVNELSDVLDYTLILPYESGSRGIGISLYGGISIHNQEIDGEIFLEYQTLGGKWLVDVDKIHQRFADKVYNPRTAYWDQVVGPSQIFPPDQHRQDFDKVHGQQQLLSVLNDLIDTLNNPSRSSDILNHLIKNNNPHNVTKEQLGIGNIGNWTRASKEQTINMSSNISLLTPHSLGQLIEAISEKYFETSRGLVSVNQLLTIPIDDPSPNPYSLNNIANRLQDKVNESQQGIDESVLIIDNISHRKLLQVNNIITYKESLN